MSFIATNCAVALCFPSIEPNSTYTGVTTITYTRQDDDENSSAPPLFSMNGSAFLFHALTSSSAQSTPTASTSSNNKSSTAAQSGSTKPTAHGKSGKGGAGKSDAAAAGDGSTLSHAPGGAAAGVELVSFKATRNRKQPLRVAKVETQASPTVISLVTSTGLSSSSSSSLPTSSREAALANELQEGGSCNHHSHSDVSSSSSMLYQDVVAVQLGEESVSLLQSSSPPGTTVELAIGFRGVLGDASVTLQGLYVTQLRHLANSNTGSGGGKNNKNASSSTFCLHSHFEVSHAREAFPCVDHPLLRVSWSLQVQLPMTYSCVTNTMAEEIKQGCGPGGQLQSIQFATTSTVPLPAYVLCLQAFEGGVVLSGDAAPGVFTERTASFESRASFADLWTQHEDEGATAMTTAANVSVCETLVPSYGPLESIRLLAPSGTAFPLAFTLDITSRAVTALEALCLCPVPVDGSQLTVTIVPKMMLGGMEHHSCIFLNEALCGSTSCASSSSSSSAGSTNGGVSVEETITRMIVHEVAHLWFGNAIGLPFEVKEGICQLLEWVVGDSLLGRPTPKLQAAAAPVAASSGGGPAASTAATSASAKAATGLSAATKRGKDTNAKSQATATSGGVATGKELTGETYQNTLRDFTAKVASMPKGFDSFVVYVLRPLIRRGFGRYVDRGEFSVLMSQAAERR